MSSNWLDETGLSVPLASLARSSHVNNLLAALVVAFDNLPAPFAGIPGTKGFGEVFVISEPTAITHPLTLGGLLNNTQVYAASAGDGATYTLTLSPAVTVLTAGMEVYFKANAVNAGATTMNLNGLGAKAMTTNAGAATVAGDIPLNGMMKITYDGTSWQLGINSTAASAASAAAAAVSETNSAASAVDSATSAAEAALSASSSLKLLETVTGTAAATLDSSLDVFDGTYSRYIVTGNITGSESALLELLFYKGAYIVTGYEYSVQGLVSNATVWASFSQSDAGTEIPIDSVDTAVSGAFTITLDSPDVATVGTHILWDSMTIRSAVSTRKSGTAYCDNTTACTGIRFQPAAGTITGSFSIYGVEN